MKNPPRPVLGSDLLSQARLASLNQPSVPSLSVSPAIDAAIGGIQYGRITSMQCDIGGYSSLLAHHVIASHLLLASNEGSQVAYVDTTGTFSALNLLKVLMFRLQQDATQLAGGNTDAAAPGAGGQNDSKEIRAKAAELLDRVQYMRTFDFDGVMEAVAEVSMGIRKDEVNADGGPGVIEHKEKDGGILPEIHMKQRGQTQEEIEEMKLEASEEVGKEAIEEVEMESGSEEGSSEKIVPDSQADSDEEIFWPVPPLPKHDPGFRKKRIREHIEAKVENIPELEIALEGAKPDQPSQDHEVEMQQSMQIHKEIPGSMEVGEQKDSPIEESKEVAVKTVGLLIVDSISRPIEDLLDTNEVSANAALTQLSRNLTGLSRKNGMTVLLLSAPVQHPAKPRDQKRNIYIKNSSIFARIGTKYGLPNILTYCVDMGIMVSKYPIDEMAAHRRRSGGQDKYIIEVTSQRYGRKAGQWSVFTVKDGIELVDAFPPERKEEKDLNYLLTENELRGKGAFGRWSRD
ncbi:hypothetical protein H072_4736 [Dactylellina haptotyla CBS 200.50]|uniref:DNA recombination and repair protein Rad51-like C-terminal domain-containing protein n=1 Tax=Dactylellina haptotyla (strain CBS 200.50) TaxID=1284197 RepID=S8AJS9_DACHA|nr:hypothetical protein H072_4736 [Dactylellina haptotyla CBS 200.50]